MRTPWGEPSAPVRTGTPPGLPVLYLARHGEPQSIAPHRIDYRANRCALADPGATQVVALNTVGGIADAALPATMWLPRQIIDCTSGRESSFDEGVLLALGHREFTHPFDAGLCELLAASEAGVQLRADGIHGCTQEPWLETAAEIGRLRRDGCDLVGMTAMPETVLAREPGLRQAMLAVVVNRAAELSSRPIAVGHMREHAAACRGQVVRVPAQLALSSGRGGNC